MSKKNKNIKLSKIDTVIEKNKKHKIIFWLILFFPYGLYLSIKHKFLPNWTNVLIFMVGVLLVVVCIDTVLYPNRVKDSNVLQNLKAFKDETGDIFDLEQTSLFNEEYYIYDVIASNGRFDVYLDGSFNILAIKQTDESNNIYNNDNFNQNYKDVYSEILKYIPTNEIGLTLNIEEVIESGSNYQILKIDGKIYEFTIENQVVVYVEKNNEMLYENQRPSIPLNNILKNKIRKKFDKINDIYIVTNFYTSDDGYEFYFKANDNKLYQIIKKPNGYISWAIETE